MATFTATITDSLGASASGSATKTAPRSGSNTIQKRSFYGHRLAFGDTQVNKAPAYDLVVTAGGVTYATKFFLLRNCDLISVRFLKAPLSNGVHTVAVWQGANQTPLATKNVTLSADDGGWVEVTLDSPVALTASDAVPYLIGYFTPSGHAVQAQWVLGTQDTVEYPFWVKNSTGFGDLQGTGVQAGSTLTYPQNDFGIGWKSWSYFVDPVVTWTSDDAFYAGGLEYYQRFGSYASITQFPIGAWASLPGSVATFKSFGVNILVDPYSGDLAAQMAAVKSSSIDVIPRVNINDLATLAAFEADSVYQSLVRGYITRDEPDLIAPYNSPAAMQAWHTELRKRAPDKLLVFNLGYTVVVNKGFDQQPPGSAMKDLNANWRQYAKVTDVISCDFYTEVPQNQNKAGSLYNLWCNPRMVGRLRDLCDNTRPTWHYVATTAPPGTEPTPATVYSSAWAFLIAGAKGIVFFDTQFTLGGTFITDNAMAGNAPMAAMVTSLCALIQSLAAPLLAADAGLSVAVSSSNTAGSGTVVGAEFGVPIHYTTRQAGGFTYLFTQSIRPGATAGTFTVPAAASKTITVLNESRTLTANSSGVFTDNYTTDYQVHLYRWS